MKCELNWIYNDYIRILKSYSWKFHLSAWLTAGILVSIVIYLDKLQYPSVPVMLIVALTTFIVWYMQAYSKCNPLKSSIKKS